MAGREFYTWDGQSFTVRLAVDVVDRLNEALADPARNKNEEHGGILLGRLIGPNEAEVTGFEFEPSQHRRGVAYNLGLREREMVGRRVRRLRRAGKDIPVGYFRTHMRPGLFLDQDDFSLMNEVFGDPGSVALLINTVFPEVPSAGFFFWEGEEIDRRQARAQFAFDGEFLRAGGLVIADPCEAPAEKKPVLIPAWLAWAAACLAALLGFWIVSAATRHSSVRAAAPVRVETVQNNRNISVSVNWEPGTSSSKRPLEPAQPLSSLRPRVPQHVAARLSTETPVDIRVSIDKNGVVQNTEVMTASDDTLASLAADDAFRASWKPARQGDAAVASKVILHYRFMPASAELP